LIGAKPVVGLYRFSRRIVQDTKRPPASTYCDEFFNLIIPIRIQDGDRGGRKGADEGVLQVRRGERLTDNEGIHLKANWYHG